MHPARSRRSMTLKGCALRPRARAVVLLAVAVIQPAGSLKAAIIGGGLGGLACCKALRKVGIDAHVSRTQAPRADSYPSGHCRSPCGSRTV